MPILGARGWEMGNSMLNTVDQTPAGIITASTVEARTGSYSLRLYGDVNIGGDARWRLETAPTDPCVSVWVYLKGSYDLTATETARHSIRFALASGHFVSLRWNGATHTYDAYVSNVLVASGTIEVPNNTWFHVQAYAVIDNAGSITVLVDGHSSIAYNGDTMPGAAGDVDYIHIRGGSTSTALSADFVDDLVFGNGGLLGDLRVFEKRPTSDDLAQWTPLVGVNNFAMEDATPNNDAEYNYTDTDGHVDQFGLSALDITGFDVAAVVAWTRAQMSDGVGDSIDVGINSNGTVSVNRTTLSTSWKYCWGNIHTVDPDTGLAWAQAGLNALLHRKVAVVV